MILVSTIPAKVLAYGDPDGYQVHKDPIGLLKSDYEVEVSPCAVLRETMLTKHPKRLLWPINKQIQPRHSTASNLLMNWDC